MPNPWLVDGTAVSHSNGPSDRPCACVSAGVVWSPSLSLSGCLPLVEGC